MNHTYLNRRTAVVSFAVALCTPLMATAQQAYPTKPIRIVLPGPAGSAPDVVMRLLSERIARQLGQPLVIDNRPGAATIIGAQAVSTAPADGYTFLFTIGSTTSINPYIYSKLPYKVEDFVPVSWVVSTPFVLVTGANSPYRSVQDLTRAAKEKPGGLAYASYGVGSTTHVAYAWLSNVAGFQMTHAPYRDGGITDIVSGLVQSSIEPAATAVQFIKAGRLRGLAVTSARRLEVLPDVPTLAESYPGIATDGW